MSRNKTTVTTETEGAAGAPTSERAPVLDGAGFSSPILQIVRTELGRFLRHDADCSGDGDDCTCGLARAVTEVARREGLLRRYGTE